MKELIGLIKFMDEYGVRYEMKNDKDLSYANLTLDVEYGDMTIVVKEDGKMNVSYDDNKAHVSELDKDAFSVKHAIYHKFIG